jgi:hypothetical protein
MARQPEAREDFLAEATALVERVELRVAGCREPILAGFRRDGSASVLFGEDPVYQFNSAGQLRRVYLRGDLYKAVAGQLVALLREASAGRLHLVERPLSRAETEQLLADLRKRLSELTESFAAGEVTVAGQVPADADVVGRVKAWLDTLPGPITIAQTPRVR